MTPSPTRMLILLTTLLYIVSPGYPWIVPQPQANVWKTLAQTLGQENICLSTDSTANPMSTCLVGIPFKSNEFPPSLVSSFLPMYNPLVPWEQFLKRLPQAKEEPHEFELLGSAKAPYCIHFMIERNAPRTRHTEIKQIKSQYIAKNWCKKISHIREPLTLTSKPHILPSGTFFICGDRAFSGIPSHLPRGPCTIDQLSLFSPNMSQILDWCQKNNTNQLDGKKRELAYLDANCNSEIIHWSRLMGVAFTVFLPWVSVVYVISSCITV